MRQIIIALGLTMALSGCASNCTHACVFGFGPGNPIFNQVADSADRDDQCQTRTHSTLTGARLKPDGHQAPDYCKYRGQRRMIITDKYGHTVGYIR